MSYPEELLPQEIFKIIDTENLLPDKVLVRKSCKAEADSFTISGDLRVDAICDHPRRVPGLSANLFAIFLADHLKYDPIDKSYHDYWNSGDEIPAKEEIEFNIAEEVLPIFFLITDLHNQKFPYQKIEPKNKIIEFEGRIEIIHKPTMCNFWHFELTIYDSEGNEITNASSGWRKKIASFLSKSFLQISAFIEEPENKLIDKAIYQN